MAYNKTNWQDTLRDAQGNVIQKGTPLNAQALSKIEDGIVTAEQKIDNEISQVTQQLAQTATKAELQAVASGSPKGVYSTVSELRGEFPTGNSNIYIVNADGNWYYWNSYDWVPGGLYKSDGLKVLQANPSSPFLGQMWLIQSYWEMFYLYDLKGESGALLDSTKMKTLFRGQTGQTHTEYGTFAKISADGNSVNLSYNPSTTGVNRGDTSIFPLVEEFNLNDYKYKIAFDMSLMGPNKSTETLGFALQKDSTSAIIDQLNNLQFRTSYVSSTQNYFQVAQTINGTSTNLQNVIYTRGTGYDGMSHIEINIEPNTVKVLVNNELIVNVSFNSTVFATGYKPSLFTQNRTKITTGVEMNNKVSNLTIERFAL